MKTLIITLLLLFISNNITAQQNFEGKIVYAMAPSEGVNQKTIEIFLKENKMLFILDGKKTLCDFNKEMSYQFDGDTLAISTGLFTKVFPYTSKVQNEDSSTTILGYNCTKTSSTILPIQKKYIHSVDNWFSNKLQFKIASKKRTLLPPIIFFNDSTISLKTIMKLTDEIPESKEVVIEAKEITPQKLPDSIFTIPAAMRVISHADYLSELLKKFNVADSALNKISDKLEVLDVQLAEVKKGDSPPPPPPPPPPPLPTKQIHKKKKVTKKS